MSGYEVIYKTDIKDVDWQTLKTTLLADNFDNGRTPQQLKESFTNSYMAVLAYHEGRVVGTARVLSDGVCNAYIVDVWTQTPYRRQGIATNMMKTVLAQLPGQHVYLFTDDAVDFYKTLGFSTQPIGMGTVVGKWLHKEMRPIT